MLYNKISLNGSWNMDYSPDLYSGEALPHLSGALIEDAVPGYFEDMTEKFKGAPFFDALVINPEYKRYEYPMSDYPPDMVLPNYVGTFFYKREITLSDTKNAAFYAEGVQNSAKIWINGAFLCYHEGYSAPFEVKIPEEMLKVGKNTVTMAVSNHTIYGFDNQPISGITSRAASRYSGGVTGDVEIRLYKSGLRDIVLTFSEDCSTAGVRIIGEVDELLWQVKDGEKVLKEGKSKANFTFDIQNLEKWSPASPKRYTIEVTSGDASISREFGVRRLLADGKYFRLNGEPYYLRGICEHCYYPETVHPTHDKDFYVNVISKLKELGFNYIRFHTHVPPKEYFMAADELGMLIQVESPNNASLAEWENIIEFARQFTSAVIYCTGNELQIDDLMVEHLSAVAKRVHAETDALFSPMSAMRGVEYGIIEPEQTVLEPFRHNPRRFKMISEFADMYSSFSIEHFSYHSLDANPELVSSWHSVYQKPRVTHEICIDGSYADLSLKKRYEGTRIGETALFTSVEKHLTDKGLIDKAPLYFKNSSEWQRRLRKYCFEATRRCENMAGYDFLGPIDTHWHTFGYDVGMMNEFYELKPGETVENVLRYNSPTVILTDIGRKRNFASGEEMSFNVLASVFEEKSGRAELNISLSGEGVTLFDKTESVYIENGGINKLSEIKFTMPEVEKPLALTLKASLVADRVISKNEWEIYLFPVAQEVEPCGISVLTNPDGDELVNRLSAGERVVVFGAKPFTHVKTSFRMSLAGRTNGFTATVIAEHPILSDMPCENFCSWQFSSLLEEGGAVVFESDKVEFDPIIEVVSTHKNAKKEAALFELACEGGKLLVCSFTFDENDPGANWLRGEIIKYANDDSWQPKHKTDAHGVQSLFGDEIVEGENVNLAVNKNDITATKK